MLLYPQTSLSGHDNLIKKIVGNRWVNVLEAFVDFHKLTGLAGIFVGNTKIIPRIGKFRIDADGLLICLNRLGWLIGFIVGIT